MAIYPRGAISRFRSPHLLQQQHIRIRLVISIVVISFIFSSHF